MFKTPQNPGLEKSKKLLFECDEEEKAECWKMNKANSPNVKIRKIGM
jgi:hypothetical protein